ncbi:MAG TPA: FtsX-like permease family protein [Vicinamibacterales bacterium]
MKFLPLVWRNLMRRKLRTFFTFMSVFIAFLLFGVLMAIRAAFSMGVEIAGADRLMMIHKVSLIQLLPRSYMERIRAVDGVTDVSHANWFGGYYQDQSNFIANMAVDPESWLRIYPEFELPEEQKKAWIGNRMGAIVGIDTAERFGWKVGDRVPLISPIYRKPDNSPWEFVIEGIYDSPVQGTDKTQFFFHWEYVNQALQDTPFADHVGWYVIRVADPASSDKLAGRIDALFANSSAETKTATEKAFIQAFASQVGDIGGIMMAIAALVMFFILFVTGNAMAQSIRERTSELGVLKTLGFTDGRILRLVLMEAALLAGSGGAAGLAAAWAITSQGDPTGGFLPAFYFPVRDLIIGGGLVAILAFGAGALPAFQASRLQITTALRRA